ncbi:hypothetical protein, partial [Actinoplanes sp. URMC 104]|uniref:hypothetical protein n=1 Tax=Actinoplanes sp. URMC 104 TaxID=3423409 RepID=UPI003F1DC3C6
RAARRRFERVWRLAWLTVAAVAIIVPFALEVRTPLVVAMTGFGIAAMAASTASLWAARRIIGNTLAPG